jgi:hypothetical protein
MFSSESREAYLKFKDRFDGPLSRRSKPGDTPKFSPYRLSTIPAWDPETEDLNLYEGHKEAKP